MMNKSLLLMIVLVISGCSLLSPIRTEPEPTYVINTIPSFVPTKNKHAIGILVLLPEANPIYNTTQIVYTIHPYQVAYFAKNHWIDTPAKMLQPLMVQTLQETGYFKTVASPPFVGQYHYILSTQLTKLQQDYSHQPAILRLELQAQLIRATTNQVIATKRFFVVEPIPQRTPYGGVVATNHAVAIILKQLAAFCIQKH